MANNLVQYVVVRGDLLKQKGAWNLGALIAQACHASSAAIHLYYEHPDTKAYLQDLDNMHKVVLEAKDEAVLKALEETLKDNAVDHKMWIEQPENYPTCLAVRPYPKAQIQDHFKGLKLYRK